LAVPILAPQLGVGLASIAGFAAIAIGKFYFLDPDIHRRFPVGEPWFILIYALFGGVLLVYRLRGVALEREVLRVQAEAAATEQLARTFVRLRDYANTPIQTIAFTTELLRATAHDLGPTLDRLERAVERLTELSQALTDYEDAHKWGPDDESLDVRMMDKQLVGIEEPDRWNGDGSLTMASRADRRRRSRCRSQTTPCPAASCGRARVPDI
jgi:hypothetical protein